MNALPHADEWRKPRQTRSERRRFQGFRNRCARIGRVAVNLWRALGAFPDGEPSPWRDVAVFLVGTAWGVMVTLGMLLAWSAHQ